MIIRIGLSFQRANHLDNNYNFGMFRNWGGGKIRKLPTSVGSLQTDLLFFRAGAPYRSHE